MAGYLPQWATLAEAEQWLAEETGEPWPLPRLIEAGLTPRTWIAPSSDLPESHMRAVFDGRHEGYLAEIIFASDLHRLAASRDGVMTMTRTPRGLIVKFTPPLAVEVADLRFARTEIQALAAAPSAQVGPTVKRAELIERNRAQWPTVRRDLDEVSRGSAWLAPARAGGGRWYEGTALALARANGRIVAPADPAPALPTWVHRANRRG